MDGVWVLAIAEIMEKLGRGDSDIYPYDAYIMILGVLDEGI
ncbi:MAG: hypothetical protein QXV76_06010 [Candidatus Bathyarchaeia archaeon]